MKQMSDRLACIAREIQKGETMVDIGTDHGFLPIYLYKSGISPRVIMTDISPNSLKKSIKNFNLYNIGDKGGEVAFRCGDGLKLLAMGEADVLVMAGMGGVLMTEIMDHDIKKTRSFKKLILQPRSGIGKLRYWLFHNGFSIIKEQLVREGRFICEIMTVVPKNMSLLDINQTAMSKEDIRWKIPYNSFDFANPLTFEYLERKLEREEFILSSIGHREKQERMLRIENATYIRSLLDK